MALDETKGGVPLRLYLDLRQDHVADLVAVSQASLAFARGVREIAYILDPSLDLQIGLAPSLPGSLWQNTILRAQDEYERRKTLYQLAAASIIWFVQPPLERVRDNLWQPHLERYLPEATKAELQESGEQIQRILSNEIAEEDRRQSYSALDRDPGITGVGVTIERVRPSIIVPHSQFALRAGREELVATELDRATVGPIHVILISPVFDPGNRRWRFATAQGEFGAAVKDKEFLDKVVRGELGLPMRAGIELDVQLETKERLINGAWQVVERNVVRVDAVHSPPPNPQTDLFAEKR